jgi:hypothetical protein
MGRVLRRYPVHFLLACAALAALPGTALATPSPTTVSARVSVSASGVTSATLRCPRHGVALSGYVSAVSGGAFARDSVPGDINHWSFHFTSSGGAGHARVGLRCLRLKLPKGVKQVQTKVFTTKSVVRPAGGSSALKRISCSKGYLPTGYGVDRSTATGGAERLLLSGAIPRSRSWDFRIKNTGASTQPVTIHLRCLGARAKQSSGSLSERFKLRRESFSGQMGSGSLDMKCAAGNYSLATGYSVPASDDISVTRATPSRVRSGRFSFRNPSGGKQHVRAFLTCLSLRTTFR